MNDIQKNYLIYDSLWNHYINTEQHDKAEEIEETLIQAEEYLIDWFLYNAIHLGIDADTHKTLRENWMIQPNIIINLALQAQLSS